MPYPQLYPFRTRIYDGPTTSTSGAPTHTAVVVGRCKYVGTWYVPNQIAGTGTNVTGYDVLCVTGATSTNAPSLTVLTSGATVTTSTGTFAQFTAAGNSTTVNLNPGDVIFTAFSTGVGGFVSHVTQEF